MLKARESSIRDDCLEKGKRRNVAIFSVATRTFRLIFLRHRQLAIMSGLGSHSHSTVMIETDGLPLPRRWFSLLAIWVAMAMSTLDNSMITLALPDIARDLQISAAQSIWVVNAYQIAVIMTVLTAASAGDAFGYRRIYLGGLVGVAAGSLFAFLADSLPILALGRVIQGLGQPGSWA